MKKIFKTSYLLAVVLLTNLAPHSTAGATSVYDNVISVAPAWQVTDSNSNSYDVNIEAAINNIANPQQKTACKAVYAKFSQMDYRTFYVTQTSRYDNAIYAQAYATNELPGTTEWDPSPGIKMASAIWHKYVAMQFKYENNHVVPFDCGDATDSQAAVMMVYGLAWSDGFTVVKTHHTEGFEITYPSNYAGNLIPHTSRVGLITGNVICANTNNVISAVHIDTQSGADHDAKTTDNASTSSTDYRYYLSEESPYHIVVLCDDEYYYGPTVDVGLYDYQHWVCIKAGMAPYCYAS